MPGWLDRIRAWKVGKERAICRHEINYSRERMEVQDNWRMELPNTWVNRMTTTSREWARSRREQAHTRRERACARRERRNSCRERGGSRRFSSGTGLFYSRTGLFYSRTYHGEGPSGALGLVPLHDTIDRIVERTPSGALGGGPLHAAASLRPLQEHVKKRHWYHSTTAESVVWFPHDNHPDLLKELVNRGLFAGCCMARQH